MQALWMALGALFFTLMALCIRLASEAHGIMEILVYRGLVGIVLFALLMRLQNVPIATPVPVLHVRRSIVGVLSMSMWFYTIAHLPMSTAMSLNSMSSVWVGTIVLAGNWWRLRRISHPWLFVIVLVGFAGVLMLLNPRFDRLPPVAGMIGLGAGMMAALAYMQVGALGKAGEPESRVVFYFSVGTTLLGLIGVLTFGEFHPVEGMHGLWLLGSGVFASLGQWCLTRAYSRGATMLAATLQYLNIVYGTLFGLWLFKEMPQPLAWLGMAIIILSGVAATAVRGHQVRKAALAAAD